MQLRLKPRQRRVRWTGETVDNEELGKRSSKICCIYHKPKAFGDSSSDSESGSESDGAKPGGVPTRRAAEKAKAARARRGHGDGASSDSSESDSSVERRRIRQRRHERDAARMQQEHQAAMAAGVVLSAALPAAGFAANPRGASPAASAQTGAGGASAAQAAAEVAPAAASPATAALALPGVKRALETSAARRGTAAAHDTGDEDGID
ncbi:hypothetical protein FNF27_02957 [Cafeteria roenbergensis]|uniref:Type 1 phosphatases regulator n=1 Tax=Cafeteria roenbergensis TaxID=33653 RepID=A0A5A8DI99_CAFRO|nr:hypothetical protein FNF29_02109 [Cafeteria roenbergensis]KAA0165062.1 hypothetical protein FNF31_02075 [Cafeteria roenbergensis]KAA0170163.1 hypothetical protein FNF28_01584 [Cafeteria roenbergensis]KAA0175547.1 hypothetical protein FNF27_02957 [Cafeteria roenbergensis]|eukprot:KAA0154965.1 hypothetical protein FNF29_02109 [Cafeteria roenbergensis]